MTQQFKLDDHSELVPLLPIPNRTVKRLSADDSADSRVKVGHRQATYKGISPVSKDPGLLFLVREIVSINEVALADRRKMSAPACPLQSKESCKYKKSLPSTLSMSG